MDITFRMSEGTFNYRVCAVMIQDGKLLVMRDERSPYFYLPGGRVKLHEAAEQAVLREVKEELGVDAKMIRPLWLVQNFFVEDVDQERYHELCLYFLVDVSHTGLLSLGESFSLAEGRHEHQFQWLDVERLEGEYLYPLFLKTAIFHLPDALELRTEYEYEETFQSGDQG